MSRISKKPQGYNTMEEVKIKGEKLFITFANGDTVEIEISSLLKPYKKHGPYKLSTTPITNGEMLFLFSFPLTINISWHTIRTLTDPQFAKELAQTAAEQIKHIGQRLSELRTSRNMTQKKVAELVGIQEANLSRIENGHFEVATSTLWKILAVMGFDASDLAVKKEED